MAKHVPSPYELAERASALRAEILAICEATLPRAMAVLHGQVSWNAQQVALFKSLLGKILSDVNHTTVDVKSDRSYTELSRDDLERLALAAARREAVDVPVGNIESEENQQPTAVDATSCQEALPSLPPLDVTEAERLLRRVEATGGVGAVPPPASRAVVPPLALMGTEHPQKPRSPQNTGSPAKFEQGKTRIARPPIVIQTPSGPRYIKPSTIIEEPGTPYERFAEAVARSVARSDGPDAIAWTGISGQQAAKKGIIAQSTYNPRILVIEPSGRMHLASSAYKAAKYLNLPQDALQAVLDGTPRPGKGPRSRRTKVNNHIAHYLTDQEKQWLSEILKQSGYEAIVPKWS